MQVVDHVHALLDNPDAKALSFAVVMPAWEDSAAWKLLQQSPCKRGEVRLKRSEQAWRTGDVTPSGAGEARRVPMDTDIFWLQNEAGAQTWPVTDEKMAAIR